MEQCAFTLSWETNSIINIIVVVVRLCKADFLPWVQWGMPHNNWKRFSNSNNTKQKRPIKIADARLRGDDVLYL